ncbi:MAG: MBL fold metallo-hydrolase [Acidobacteria bacterium]|nr:MBL fold metallo-hydrolase [Acidobacteriota bacterium]
MKRIGKFALASFVLLASCTTRTPEQAVIHDAAEALGGGEARLGTVRTLIVEGGGTNFNLGQDMVPDASGQTFTVTEYRRVIDVVNGRQRVEQTRTPNFAYFQGPAAQKQVFGLDGDMGYNVAANGNASRTSATVGQDRRREFYHHPITLIRAALDPAAKLANAQTVGTDRKVDITIAAGIDLTLTIDNDGLPKSVSSRTYHGNLGDVMITTSFADYQDVNGLKLPGRMTTRTDNFTTAEIRATKQTLDADAGDLAVPGTASAAPASTPAINVTAETVAPGVWFLAGQSHHSVLVEFSDHLMLIEAPQSEARTLAVIAKARELKPEKPLTKLVTTHHHFDHTAGLRAAISEGLTVITHAGNKAFVETMAKRQHTIQQDALAKSSKPVTVQTVDTELEMKDAANTVMLYHVAGNPHSDTMLMAYIPRAQVLVEVDAFSPGSQAQPYAANLLENINKRNLRVTRVVPLHGTIVPMNELVKVVTSRS